MTQLLNGAPCAEAGVTCFALGATGVVAGVLVKRDGAGEVRCADDVATAAAVVLAEVPRESSRTQRTGLGRFIRLKGRC